MTTMSLLFKFLIIIFMILRMSISKNIFIANSIHEVVFKLTIRTIMDIILGIATLISTCISIWVNESGILIALSLITTIIWEINADKGIRFIRFIKKYPEYIEEAKKKF